MIRRAQFLAVVAALAVLASAQNLPRTSAAPAFTISGTVVNASTGAPIPGATVAIAPVERRTAVRTVRSDKHGAFWFDKLAPGKYSLDAEARGFPRQGFNQHEMYSSAIAVGPNDASEGLVFRLQPDAAISGTVTDEFNEPVRTGQVMLFREGLQNGSYEIRMIAQHETDDQGAYHFGHLRAGKYYVAVAAQPWYARVARSSHLRRMVINGANATAHAETSDGPEAKSDPSLDVAYPLTFYAGAADSASATPIVLSPGDITAADFALAPVPAVHVRITDAQSKSGTGLILYFTQRAFGRDIPVMGQSSSNESGILELNGVAPGNYVLHMQVFDQDGRRSRTAPVRELHVSGNTEVDARQVWLSPPQSITGTVVFEGSSSPPPEATVELHNRQSGETVGGKIKPSGEFEIAQSLAPGTYDVFVATRMGFLTKTIVAVGAKVFGPAIELGKAGPVRMQVIAAHEFGRVDGIAVEGDKPVAGAMVVLVPQHGLSPLWIRRDQSDSDGTFTLAQVVPGTYTIVAIKNGWDLPWASPGVLTPYLAHGQRVDIAPNGKYNAKVTVQ